MRITAPPLKYVADARRASLSISLFLNATRILAQGSRKVCAPALQQAFLLDAKVLVHESHGQAAGSNFERLRPLLAQAAKKHLTPLDELHARGVAVHSAGCLRATGKKFLNIRLAQRDEQHEMAGGEARGALDHLGGCRSFGQVGKPDHQTAPALAFEQKIGGAAWSASTSSPRTEES
jgi:hypothetical protein